MSFDVVSGNLRTFPVSCFKRNNGKGSGRRWKPKASAYSNENDSGFSTGSAGSEGVPFRLRLEQ